ncbi:hypothetical protein GYMLUDRAFT_394552 [Collybiopsis luxurians FD-317 M1]|uniref:Stress-response A/B barrel domain-containing protein n=1 Tax=Collybiopsis luxurians FD-317 M1 TaxID=944289 RepID=A0A0D0AMK6_9AGAR|nr:hypothetical protein GYMLUDRAFT_394552 [Collybiopsis luxurians FD-317 M1]
MITHIVFVKFTPGSTEEQKKKWRIEIAALKDKIPTIKNLIVGDKVGVPRGPVLDGGWEDAALVMFDTEEEYRAYVTTDAHAAYKAATAGIVGDKLIYNIQS